MIYAVVALAASQALTALAFLRYVSSKERRENARERGLLINQILHLTGRTWQEPPRAEKTIEPDGMELVYMNPSMWPE